MREQLVPLARQAPGFVDGYWTCNLATGKAYSITVLDSEEAAVRMMEFVQRDLAERGQAYGVRLDDIGLAEIVAKA